MLEQNAPRFRYIFTSEFGRRVLQADPKGWEELGVHLHRDPKTHGTTLAYLTQAAFIADGRVYLSQAYAQRGIEADVLLTIEQYDPNTFAWQFYTDGQVDFLSRVETAGEFRCNIVQQDFTQKFLNRDDTAVDAFGADSLSGVALPAKQPLTLPLHSQATFKRYVADYLPGDPRPVGTNFVFDYESRFQLIYFGFGQPQVDDFGVQEVVGGPIVGRQDEAVPIYRATEEGEFTIDFATYTQLKIKRTASSGQGDFDKVNGEYHFRINDEPPTVLAVFGRGGIGDDFFDTIDVAHRVSRRLNIGDRIYLYGWLFIDEVTTNILGQINFQIDVQNNGGHFHMQALTRTLPTDCQGLLAYEALERVCQAATDERVAFRSAFFGRTDTQPAYRGDGPGAGTFISGGFQVRGFPLSVKPMTLTWRGLYDSLAGAYWLGSGVEQRPEGKVVVVEPVPYFYPDTLTLDLSATPVEVTSTTEGEDFYNGAELGYRKWQTEAVNGLQEPNSRREWALPLAAVKNTYSVLLPYSAAGFYLETTRRQRYDATATTDQSSDADNFLICVLRGPAGWQTERDQLYERVDGALSPDSLYNLRLTPARLLRRHGPALRAGLLHQSRGTVRFTVGEGNNELVTQLRGEAGPVAEAAPVPVEALGAALWRPERDEFTTRISREQVRQLLQAPTGRIRYHTAAGERREGWIMDFKHTASRNEGTFTLRPALTLLPLS